MNRIQILVKHLVLSLLFLNFVHLIHLQQSILDWGLFLLEYVVTGILVGIGVVLVGEGGLFLGDAGNVDFSGV